MKALDYVNLYFTGYIYNLATIFKALNDAIGLVGEFAKRFQTKLVGIFYNLILLVYGKWLLD